MYIYDKCNHLCFVNLNCGPTLTESIEETKQIVTPIVHRKYFSEILRQYVYEVDNVYFFIEEIKEDYPNMIVTKENRTFANIVLNNIAEKKITDTLEKELVY